MNDRTYFRIKPISFARNNMLYRITLFLLLSFSPTITIFGSQLPEDLVETDDDGFTLITPLSITPCSSTESLSISPEPQLPSTLSENTVKTIVPTASIPKANASPQTASITHVAQAALLSVPQPKKQPAKPANPGTTASSSHNPILGMKPAAAHMPMKLPNNPYNPTQNGNASRLEQVTISILAPDSYDNHHATKTNDLATNHAYTCCGKPCSCCSQCIVS